MPALEHRFGVGPEYRVGVEEELMLVDAASLALTPAVEPITRAVGDPERVKPELMQSQVEIATSPCRTAREALAELSELRTAVVRAGALHGVRVAACGTHPFGLAEEQTFTQRDRYRELVAEIRYPVRRELCCGLHVHVSVDGADKAVAVLEGLVPHLPLLLALSTSSPFWRGEASGLASTRTIVFQSMPRSGLPPAFFSYADFAAQLDLLASAGAVADHSRMWWDARPHPRCGTVEVRIMDVQPRVEDTAALAALVQSLVRRLGRRYDRGERAGPAPRAIVAENRWLAARHGLRAQLVGPHGAAPARELVSELLEDLADEADSLDVGWAFERLHRLTRQGTSADRQVALARAGQPLDAVLAAVANETAA